jgi:hypothetical protein
MDLVAGRHCGQCSVCCVVLNIDSKEFQKFPGLPCTYLRQGKGCAIHDTVFPTCRHYYCAWRHLAAFGEDWRPDKSGVLIDFQTDELPDAYPKRPGIRFMIVGPVETMFRRSFLEAVRSLLAAEVPVVLAVPGPPKHFPAKVFLNDLLTGPVRAGDFARIEAVFRELAAGLAGHRFNPVEHVNLPPHNLPDPSSLGPK